MVQEKSFIPSVLVASSYIKPCDDQIQDHSPNQLFKLVFKKIVLSHRIRICSGAVSFSSQPLKMLKESRRKTSPDQYVDWLKSLLLNKFK